MGDKRRAGTPVELTPIEFKLLAVFISLIQDSYEAAEQHFKLALQDRPNFLLAHLGLPQVYQKTGDEDRALTLLRFGLVPVFLFLVLAGDFILVAGGLVVFSIRGRKEFPPSLYGKISTILQVGTVLRDAISGCGR